MLILGLCYNDEVGIIDSLHGDGGAGVERVKERDKTERDEAQHSVWGLRGRNLPKGFLVGIADEEKRRRVRVPELSFHVITDELKVGEKILRFVEAFLEILELPNVAEPQPFRTSTGCGRGRRVARFHYDNEFDV